MGQAYSWSRQYERKGETVRTKNYKENVNAISRLFLEVNWMPQVSSIYACNISFGKSVRTCNWRNNFFKLSFFFSSTEMWNSSQSNNLFRALVPLANLLAMDISIYLMGGQQNICRTKSRRENLRKSRAMISPIEKSSRNIWSVGRPNEEKNMTIWVSPKYRWRGWGGIWLS